MTAKPTPWRTTLRLLRPRFAASSTRYQGLCHALSIASETKKDRLAGPPFASTPEQPFNVARGARLHPVRSMQLSAITHRRLSPWQRAPGSAELDPRVFYYSAGYFGCGDRLERTIAALSAFDNLAQTAWRCLPPEVRAAAVVEPYLDPAEARTDAGSWTLCLYAWAWKLPRGSALKAERRVQARLRSGGHVAVNYEHFFGLPDPVPAEDFGVAPVDGAQTRPKADVVAELLEEMRDGPYGTIAAGELVYPTEHFAAFLEPDAFLASALAIDALLASPDGAEERGPRRKRAVAAKYREPTELTRPVSLNMAATWFKMDLRTLQKAMADGQIRARQLSPQRWVFDLAQVSAHNFDAANDADPVKGVAPKPKARRKRPPSKGG